MIYANREWSYEYTRMPSEFSEEVVQKVTSRMLVRYSKITKEWSSDRNSEWLCRTYLAAKLIMQATLTVNSMLYAKERNLRVVVPYLKYYSALSLMRSVVLMLPEQSWNEGRIISLGHEKILKLVVCHVAEFDKNAASSIERKIRSLRASRELISYRAPSSGDEAIPDVSEFLGLCALIAEIAQFDSELLEVSLNKNSDPKYFELISDYLYELSNVSIGPHTFGDNEDAYRLDYFKRKQPHMVNIRFLMREGHVDDFFGAWSDSEDVNGAFDPDEMNGIIFDIQ